MTTTEPSETFLQKQKRLKAEREAAERGTPAWTLADHTGTVEQGNPRAQAWVQAKVSAQLTELAARPEGDRNDHLNHVAYSMGRLTPKWLDYSEIGNQLYDAAIACGLEHDESVATIRSGLEGGMKDPRDPPVSQDDDLLPPVDMSTGEITPPTAIEDAQAAVEQTLEEKPVPPTLHEHLLAREVAILRARKAAQRVIVQEEMAAQFREPPSRATLTDELLLTDEPVRFALSEILPEGANALLTAQYKTGKTTTINDLIRAYADSVPFLGRYDVTPARGRIAVFNYELSEQQYRAWLRELGIKNTDAVSVLNLRGYRLPLTVPAVEDWIVGWLKDHDVRFWIADPLARAATGTDEDSNTEMGVWLDTFDVIKERAGVSEAVLPNHTGRAQQDEGAERGRGATRVDDWADVRWILTKDDDGNRFFRATGRDVEVAEQKLEYDPVTRGLRLGGGDRAWVKRRTVQDAVLGYVLLNPGCTAGDIEVGVTGANKDIGAARKTLVAGREIREERTGKAFRYYPPGACSPSSP